MIVIDKRQLANEASKLRRRERRKDPKYVEQQRIYQQTHRQDKSVKESNRLYQENRRRVANRPTRKELTIKHANDFLINAKLIHGNQYSYDNVVFVTCYKKVSITCQIHGPFLQTPTAHIHGKQGCPHCATILRKQYATSLIKTNTQFIKDAIFKHGTKYDYQETQYVNSRSKVIIICPNHGKFSQAPTSHLAGQGCPACANERRGAFLQSAGEQKIECCLQRLNIKYEQQKTFTDCVYKMLLRYDFFVPDKNLLIEFDGEQHFTFIKKFHKTAEMFEIFKHRDHLKNVYAETNNIKLLRIGYKQQHLIDDLIVNAITTHFGNRII